MLLYNDAIREAHYLKEWFYDVCQNEKYSYQRTAFWDWIKAAEKSGIPEFENAPRHIETGQKGYLMPSNTNIPTVLQKVIIIKSRY